MVQSMEITQSNVAILSMMDISSFISPHYLWRPFGPFSVPINRQHLPFVKLEKYLIVIK